MQNKDVDLYIGNTYFMTAKAGSSGLIKIKKNNNIGKRLMKSMSDGEKIRLVY